MRVLSGKVAAITGAASGFGRALASRLVAEGCHVALCDVDSRGLGSVTQSLDSSPVQVSAEVVDVSDRNEVFDWAQEVRRTHGCVNLVVNNAGVATFDSVAEQSIEDLEWLLSINLWGVVYGTRAFLPHLLASGDGHIVNISSIGGFLTSPFMSAYCTSKFAVRGYTESLAQELSGSCVGVTCVHPGGIRTNIVQSSRIGTAMRQDRDRLVGAMEGHFLTTPERAAELTVRAIKQGKLRLLIGRDALFVYHLSRLLPVGAVRLARILSGLSLGGGLEDDLRSRLARSEGRSH